MKKNVLLIIESIKGDKSSFLMKISH